MADGNAAPATALEEAIATNPVALSPLLLKRTGLLTVEIAAWCGHGCAIVNALAEELNVVRPNVFDRRPCEAELLGKRLDALLALGLSKREPGNGGLQREGFDEDFKQLFQSLANDFLELARQEIELHVANYVLRVEREEPNGGSEDFEALKARRDVKARAVATNEFQKRALARAEASGQARPSAPFLQVWLEQVIATATASPKDRTPNSDLIPVDPLANVLASLSAARAKFEELRSNAIKELKERPALAGRRVVLKLPEKRFDLIVTELVDQTLGLLRVEVLKDVLEANYHPSLETNPIRPDQVAKALNDLKASLRTLSGGPTREDVVREYCTLMFKQGRVEVLSALLTEQFVNDSGDDTTQSGLRPNGPNGPAPAGSPNSPADAGGGGVKRLRERYEPIYEELKASKGTKKSKKVVSIAHAPARGARTKQNRTEKDR